MQQAATVAAAAVAVALLLDLIYACQCFMIEWGAHTAKQRENDRESERERDREPDIQRKKKELNSTHKYVFILHAALPCQ